MLYWKEVAGIITTAHSNSWHGVIIWWLYIGALKAGSCSHSLHWSITCPFYGSIPRKILYFSDGAAAQYNVQNRKNVINLCYHEADFRVPAEWHFSATSHGKGACDGVGSSVKRMAVRASLQCPYDHQIMTPRQLFEWAVVNIPATSFQYSTLEDYKSEEVLLEQRFQQSRTIPGTRKLHCFIPVSRSKVSTQVYSSTATSTKDSHCPGKWACTWKQRICYMCVWWKEVGCMCSSSGRVQWASKC